MKYFYTIYFFAVVATVSLLGFRGCTSERTPLEVFPDMDRQHKFRPQAESGFFADRRADRPQVPGSVPHITADQEAFPHTAPDNKFREDGYLATGKQQDGSFGAGFPVPVTHEAMARGQELFNIYCAICHGQTGDGKGVVANERYGYATIISLLQSRLATMPEGEIFNTITYGKNTMGPYGAKIRTEDRWKVILYLRALQRAANGTAADVPADKKGELGL